MRTPVLLTAVLLAGCGWQGAPSPSNSNLQPAVAQARPTLEAARPVAIDEQSELLDFHLAWPAEVSAIPSLAERIRSPAMAH